MVQSIRILIIDNSPIRAAILDEGLREAGYDDVTIIGDTRNLLKRIVELDPDAIFIDLENPNRDVLEQMFEVSRYVQRPIAMFVDQSDDATINEAVEAGVSAYIVDGLKKERMQPILNMTIARFKAFNRLQEELASTKAALEERKLVDRAKLLLMKTHGLSEADAYERLRTSAMREGKRIGQIADALVTAMSLLGTDVPDGTDKGVS
ncbi:ANTAR domain-containing protein [Ahrensia marina]|jgi:response regulator NasT|uniref:ANTAR domain-containing response regulator n=1 Tax=Ahrensia marina TaxID=1514904 RepID=UPI0035CEFE5B